MSAKSHQSPAKQHRTMASLQHGGQTESTDPAHTMQWTASPFYQFDYFSPGESSNLSFTMSSPPCNIPALATESVGVAMPNLLDPHPEHFSSNISPSIFSPPEQRASRHPKKSQHYRDPNVVERGGIAQLAESTSMNKLTSSPHSRPESRNSVDVLAMLESPHHQSLWGSVRHTMAGSSSSSSSGQLPPIHHALLHITSSSSGGGSSSSSSTNRAAMEVVGSENTNQKLVNKKGKNKTIKNGGMDDNIGGGDGKLINKKSPQSVSMIDDPAGSNAKRSYKKKSKKIDASSAAAVSSSSSDGSSTSPDDSLGSGSGDGRPQQRLQQQGGGGGQSFVSAAEDSSSNDSVPSASLMSVVTAAAASASGGPLRNYQYPHPQQQQHSQSGFGMNHAAGDDEAGNRGMMIQDQNVVVSGHASMTTTSTGRQIKVHHALLENYDLAQYFEKNVSNGSSLQQNVAAATSAVPAGTMTTTSTATAGSLAASAGDGRKGKKSGTTPSSERNVTVCNCKKSKCLKLYCDCFAVLNYCGAQCNCHDCCNNPDRETTRQEAIRVTKDRNAFAFKTKINEKEMHNTGCHCKNSQCLKKYCECYTGAAYCGTNCKCQSCLNFDGSTELAKARSNSRDPDSSSSRKRKESPLGISSHVLASASAGGSGGSVRSASSSATGATAAVAAVAMKTASASAATPSTATTSTDSAAMSTGSSLESASNASVGATSQRLRSDNSVNTTLAASLPDPDTGGGGGGGGAAGLESDGKPLVTGSSNSSASTGTIEEAGGRRMALRGAGGNSKSDNNYSSSSTSTSTSSSSTRTLDLSSSTPLSGGTDIDVESSVESSYHSRLSKRSRLSTPGRGGGNNNNNMNARSSSSSSSSSSSTRQLRSKRGSPAAAETTMDVEVSADAAAGINHSSQQNDRGDCTHDSGTKKRQVKFNVEPIVYPFFGPNLPQISKVVALQCLECLDGKDLYSMSIVNTLWSTTVMDDALWE
eukprot:CAMPEP_0174980524 /NCGR_PEP_ID=MMETSP0004_2-20121128/15398_1 /TAXON_ID=420556 /ORGANISM="Ochromonas sp., Strain CCMP1393" /LENGTH=980 /DNA_ID=CAMNT_0016232199 /DNA_START=22 /DNA_END=2965 /DNA_ORIENTATION=-